jgi:hypothetical protein
MSCSRWNKTPLQFVLMGIQLSNEGVDINMGSPLEITASNPTIAFGAQSTQCPLNSVPIIFISLLRWIRETHVALLYVA